jgi:hypothetical protein
MLPHHQAAIDMAKIGEQRGHSLALAVERARVSGGLLRRNVQVGG